MKTLAMEDLLSNSSYDLELEKIKNKINTLYLNMITKIFKASNPGASEISLQEFLEENKIEFGETETLKQNLYQFRPKVCFPLRKQELYQKQNL